VIPGRMTRRCGLDSGRSKGSRGAGEDPGPASDVACNLVPIGRNVPPRMPRFNGLPGPARRRRRRVAPPAGDSGHRLEAAVGPAVGAWGEEAVGTLTMRFAASYAGPTQPGSNPGAKPGLDEGVAGSQAFQSSPPRADSALAGVGEDVQQFHGRLSVRVVPPRLTGRGCGGTGAGSMSGPRGANGRPRVPGRRSRS
jgi:hypothetical protein